MNLFKLAQEFQDKLKGSNQKKLEQIELIYNMAMEMSQDLARAMEVRQVDVSGDDNPEFFFGPGIKRYVKNWPRTKTDKQIPIGMGWFLPDNLRNRIGQAISFLDHFSYDLSKYSSNSQEQKLGKAKHSLNEFKTYINSVWPIFSDSFKTSLF